MDTDIDARRSNLRSRLDQSLSPFCNLRNWQDYITTSQRLPETLQEFFVLLARTDVNEQPIEWIIVLERFVELSTIIAFNHKQYKSAMDGQLSSASIAFEKSLLLIVKYMESFYRIYQPNLTQSEGKDAFLSFVSKTIAYIMGCIGIFELDCLIRSLVVCVSRYLAITELSEGADFDAETKIDVCRLVVELSKVSFFGGCPSAILPLVFMQPQCISESFVLPVVGYEDFDIRTLIDYFKYSAYCLVSCVVELESIDDEIAKKADCFLKVLLNLPNLQLTNYALEIEKSGDFLIQLSSKHVSLAEREELSFFYLLNYMLRARRLENITDTEKYFKRELKFFIDSFNNRSASELDKLASVPLSRSGSYVSVPRTVESSYVDLSPDTTLTLSSILHDGTYKERLKLVVDFFSLVRSNTSLGSLARLVQTFDMSQVHTTQEHNHLNNTNGEIMNVIFRIYSTKSPGKRLYLGAVDKIVRLIQLLALKFFTLNVGSVQEPREILKQVFVTKYTMDQIVSVKPLLKLERHRMICINKKEWSDHEIYMHQLNIIERTQALEHNIQRLV